MTLIHNNVDKYMKWLFDKLDSKTYTLHDDDDPFYRILIDYAIAKRGLSMSYEQGKEFMCLAKSISQYQGEFWQKLFGSHDGWTDLKIGHETKCDLIHNEKKLIIELKNKYNTMNSDSYSKVLDKLQLNSKNGFTAILGIVHDKKEEGRIQELKNNIKLISGSHLFETIYENIHAKEIIYERIAALCDDTEKYAKYLSKRIFNTLLLKERQDEYENDLEIMMNKITM